MTINNIFTRSIYLLLVFLLFGCSQTSKTEPHSVSREQDSVKVENEIEKKDITADDIVIKKDFLYDKYTLEDKYPYKDTARIFQWDKIKERLAYLETIQQGTVEWGILQNYKNMNGEASLVKEYKRNEYERVVDAFGIERYQSIPLFSPKDTIAGERYEQDGSLVKLINKPDSTSSYVEVETTNFKGKWFVPKKYVKLLPDTTTFKKAIVVDVTNQNIATMEKTDSAWVVRSMNPATSGAHNPPYQKETPIGLFAIQEKKNKMFYLVDGTSEIAGYAPYASRFTDGGYLHGIPVNNPKGNMIEYSRTLGTTPRSHMCVRNATSHARFIYDWATVGQSVVFVID